MVCCYLIANLLHNVSTIKDYSSFLYNRFVLRHYQSIITEVHLLFDTPGSDEDFNPKLFEQNRRDKGKEAACHNHIAFTPSTSTPNPWKYFIDCRKCKASIIDTLHLSLIQIIRQKLLPGQTLYLSGCYPQNSTTLTYKFSGMQDLLLDSMLMAYCLTLVKIKGREVSWHSSDLSGPSISRSISQPWHL